jgi:hypothetical protein
MSCGVPQAIAPEVVGWTRKSRPPCYWIRRAGSAEEVGGGEAKVFSGAHSFLRTLKPKFSECVRGGFKPPPPKKPRSAAEAGLGLGSVAQLKPCPDEKQVPRLRSG